MIFRNLAYSLDTAVLEIIGYFKSIMNYGHTITVWLMLSFITIQIILVSMKIITDPFQHEIKLGQLGYKACITLLLMFIIRNIDILGIQFADFIQSYTTRSASSSVNQIDGSFFVSPTAILEYAFKDIISAFFENEGTRFRNLVSAYVHSINPARVLLKIAGIAMVVAFIILALQLVASQIEFYIVLTISVVLMPFTLLKPTQFVGGAVYKLVAGHGIKLGVVSLVVGLGVSTLKRIINPQTIDFSSIGNAAVTFGEQLSGAVTLLIISFLIVWLANITPSIASSFITGTPASSQGIVQTLSHTAHLVRTALAATSGAGAAFASGFTSQRAAGIAHALGTGGGSSGSASSGGGGNAAENKSTGTTGTASGGAAAEPNSTRDTGNETAK